MDIEDTSSPSGPSRSPLAMDLQQECRSLLEDLHYDAASFSTTGFPLHIGSAVLEHASSDDSSSLSAPTVLLDQLAALLSAEAAYEAVVTRFRPIILDLLARWLDEKQLTESEWEVRLAIVAQLAEALPELWSFISVWIAQSPFQSSPLAVLSPSDLPSESPQCIHRLLLAYWRILLADPLIGARNEWPLDSLHLLRTQHTDLGVRLLAIQVLSKLRGWNESKRIDMEKEWVGDMGAVDVPVIFGKVLVSTPDGATKEQDVVVDGWMLPAAEDNRVKKLQSAVDASTSRTSATHSTTIEQSELSSRVASLSNVLLLRQAPKRALNPTFVHVATDSINSATGSIAALLQFGLPVLLSSPPSSGKTHLLHYLSSELYPGVDATNRILTIPLADTTIDVKSLIGTYVSSPTRPGVFEWMEGALAKAVRAGRWVVFDDIDRASMEMLVTVAGLARSLKVGKAGRRATLAVPGKDAIEAGNGFGLFVTRTTRPDAPTPASFFGHQLFVEVHLDGPTNEDILAILSARFALLPRSITEGLVTIWRELRLLVKLGGHAKGREIGLRDLEKWCARVERSLPPLATLQAFEQAGAGPFASPVFQDEVMLEAADVFLGSLDSKAAASEKRSLMVRAIALPIGMDEDRAFALLDNRKPQLEVVTSNRTLRIGRTTLPTVPTDRRKSASTSRHFALTKPSLVLLERIAAAASMGEPTLLVGETGTGKTTAVQYIADICHRPLTVLNLSTQTESSDLIGGYKPIDASASARGIHAKWQKLFCESFSVGKASNSTYLEAAAKALSGKKWGRCADLWATSARRAIDKLTKVDVDDDSTPPGSGGDTPRKRRKVAGPKAVEAAVQWQSLLVDIADFDLHHVKMKSKLVFHFVEGPLVKAIQTGEWILLDEVNLASQETLEAIATILEGTAASLVLTERGDVEPVPRHPDFRLFACMNPATDVGKKDLPPNLRARFTEIYSPPPDDDREALVIIVAQYLGNAAAGDKAIILDVADMYSTLKRMSSSKDIVDGSNIAPHYSMRTLARALSFAVETAPLFGLRRGLWEGCLMGFTMSLDIVSAKKAHAVLERHLLTPMKNARAVLAQIPSLPSGVDVDDYVRFGSFWLMRGPLPAVQETRYIITPSVQAKLSDLARVILTHRYPVLIQGPTSAGKTSAIEFLARQTGHRFVRINNHEHTDIQEYLGTYVTDPQTGNLMFQEGLLVTAVRQGHWIVLDELNLAPTDVLEALNRLLDDNRELIIPETQEVIKPHPNFILFATQNPPGLYAGRKVLSRAFRNRFLEVHFDDVPKDELETILCQRCQIAPSYAKRIVQVFEELRHRRQASRVFESKSSFATLRDLFRWAERGAMGYQQLAEDGFMLLAERARHDEDKAVIKQVIEDVMKVSIDDRGMYNLFDKEKPALARLPLDSVPESEMVWTRAMQRLFVLVASALAHDEPVLLVGETGCGKTSVCEVVAHAFNQQLVGVNCHQNMETADLLGSQRPVRNRNERRAGVIATLSEFTMVDSTACSDDDLAALCDQLLRNPEADRVRLLACQREIKLLSALFEWSDGPLVHAMQCGDLLLLDEVSLADDSVLERLNSVLEPGRTLVLAEKGGVDIDEATLVANDAFHVVATMNPGGDFGKKELSPALRNRFTEIWVPALNDREDLLHIIASSWRQQELRSLGPLVLDFFSSFCQRIGNSGGLGLRDILAWVRFSDQIFAQGILDAALAFHHGGQMVFVDGLESLPQIAGMPSSSVSQLRAECLTELTRLASTLSGTLEATVHADLRVSISADKVTIDAFTIPRGSVTVDSSAFRFEAPSTALNAMRVIRACQLPKAILLEGSPGVGKTSLVAALAAVAGHHLQRINLSDQTDLIDLFGSDLPVEGAQAGEFQWRDAAFLDAMQKGDWVLLDEMNLASQTVLEGLNAVLDHRGTVFIPELGRAFQRHPDFRVFAAQNPLQQGGGRKGLPKSFLNRFTKVYLLEHTAQDLLLICQHLNPMPSNMVQRMIGFNEAVREQTMVLKAIGREGSPWEFNLRDLFRWFQLLSRSNGLEISDHPVEFLKLVYVLRFRNDRDRQAIIELFELIFDCAVDTSRPAPFVSQDWLQIGHALVSRIGSASVPLGISHDHLDLAESILKSIEMGWLVILAGESGAGKRSLLRGISAAAGRPLGEFAMHPGVDTSEILGSFEQQDVNRLCTQLLRAVSELVSVSQENKSAPFNVDLSPVNQTVSRFQSSPTDSHLAQIVTGCNTLLSSLEPYADITPANSALHQLATAGANAVGFTWIDGELLHAIRTGGWFLISDANLCSASVLDRLNSLCETNGVLVMNEKGSSTGSPEIIKPHPDFRLFMTYDPRYGELSRAMRNRGVELFVHRPMAHQAATATAALQDHAILHSTAVIASASDISPSSVANIAAWQPRCLIPLLDRFAVHIGGDQASWLHASSLLLQTVGEWATADVSAERLPRSLVKQLPMDASVIPNVPVRHTDLLFRMLQVFLRNVNDTSRISTWLSEPANAPTVLASSASALIRGGSRRKALLGQEVYPLTSTLRQIVAHKLPQILEAVDQPEQGLPDSLERILVYVRLIEQHAMNTAFDYSSTRLLGSWLLPDLTKIPAFHAAESKLANLAKGLVITSGLGQAAVWAHFRSQRASIQLDDETATAVARLTDFELRNSVLEALMIGGHPKEDLGVLLCSLPAQQTIISPDSAWQNGAVSRVLELDLISGPLRTDTSAHAHNPLKALLADRSLPLVDIARTATSVARPQGEAQPIYNVVASWMQRLWGMTTSGEIKPDPADLFAPVRLQSTLRFSGREKVTLLDIPVEQSAFDFAIKSLSWGARHEGQPRSEVLAVALRVIADLFTGLGASIRASNGHTPQAVELLNASATSEDWIRQLIDRHLRVPLLTITSKGVDLGSIADLWLAVAHFLFETYVTNIAIDPVVRRTLLEEIVNLRITMLEEERLAIEASERAIKGVADSKRLRRVRDRLSSVTADKEALGPVAHRSSDPARLAVLFSEVHAFLGETASFDKTEQLASAILSGDAHAKQREDSFQQSAAAFVHRLKTNFYDLRDLTEPIVFGILCAKFGLRCLARHVESGATGQAKLLEAALSFPTTRALATLQAVAPSIRNDVTTQILLTVAAAYQSESLEERTACLPLLFGHFGRLYEMWSAIRLKEAEDSQAAESLYRVRKTDIQVLSDEEQEEKEFAELFPSFDDVNDETTVSKVSEPTDMTPTFSTEHLAAFHKLIMAVASRSKEPVTHLLREAVEDLLRKTFNYRDFEESFDQYTLPHQVRVLHRRLLETQVPPNKVNFYLSPNQIEVRKAHSLVSRLVDRLNRLIADWPEQMVLQHIRDRCLQVLSLDLRSPVAKILSALEQLLVHTDDWEGYANRENSIKSFQAEASDLIVSWRRLELSSWMRLLDDQFDQYIAGDNEWTLRLYGTLIHGASAAVDIDKHIASTLPMLATYLSSSSIGRFQSRLQVLQSFQALTAQLYGQHDSTQHFSRISAMLYNVISNARLFATRISESLQSQRAIIDKAIKDFVKLASWKDVNVFALKASAQKSHRQLHRSIRKFRDVLHQPVAPILSDLNSICPQDPPEQSPHGVPPFTNTLDTSTLAIKASGRSSVPQLAPLQRLEDTYSKFVSVINPAGGHISRDLGAELDDMAIEIIETSAMLARLTPSNLTKDNAKIVNNLAARKRKAYADLLKSLRVCGFSQNVRADMLQHQQSTAWMSERPPLHRACLTEILDPTQAGKLEDYSHRVPVLITGLRLAFNGHNPDIASQDLQRGIGYTESLLATAVTERDRLTGQLDNLRQLNSTVERLSGCTADGSLLGGEVIAKRLVASELVLRQLADGLSEVENGIRQFRELEGSAATAEDLLAVQNFSQTAVAMAKSVATVNCGSRAAKCLLYTPNETDLITHTVKFAEQVAADLAKCMTQQPEFRHLLRPLIDLATSIDVAPIVSNQVEISNDLWIESDQLLQALLVVAQGVKTQRKDDKDLSERPHVHLALAERTTLLQSLHIEDVMDRLGYFGDAVAKALDGASPSTAACVCVARVLPFVEALTVQYKTVLSDHAFAIKSVYKLTYVVGRIMLDLAQKGFCKPSEESQGDKDGADGETVEGTGMGSGTGDKNVSSEIEEEGQVEGLQGENEEEEQEGDKGDDDNDDAMSMENDFEGKMEDSKERDEEDEGDEDEDKQPNDHVGDIDPLEPGAVDEKFWGDDEQKDEGNEAGEDLTQQETKEQDGETELSAKEKETQDNKRKQDIQEEPAENTHETPDDTQHENTEINDNEDNAEHDSQEADDVNDEEQQPAGQDQTEVEMPEGDRLELPEDLDLGGQEEDENRDDLDDDITMDGEDGDTGEEEGAEPEDAGMASQDDGEDVEDAPAATGATEEESNEPEATLNQEIDISASNDAQAQESADLGNGSGGTAEQDREQKDDAAEKTEAMDVDDAETQPPGQGSASQQPQSGSSAEQAEGDGPVDSTGAPIPAEQTGPPQASRSLGDIMKDIRRRRDEILAQHEREEPAAQPSSDEAPGQVEYLQDDQEEDAQALGPAGEEQRQKLEDLNIIDDDLEGDGQAALEEDEDMLDDETAIPPQRPPESTVKSERDSGEDQHTSEKALTRADISANGTEPRPDETTNPETADSKIEAAETKPDIVDGEKIIELGELPAAEMTSTTGEDTWRQYASLTSELSYALCEQLRLVLEPTLATRLQGDFRTGKRLNMRKIIPYIASEYTKDKIWLRRTKPSRREYQVLLSVDDSRSMAESRSVHLAYQTLALVSQALNKLEVGQIAIARFGDSVDILHPFGEAGFSDADGAQVMNSFKFDQHRTDVVALVDRTLSFLAEARQAQAASASAPDLWQLQIIISDGICQDHERLRVLLRRALEERVMIVFIIVDSLHQPSSQPSLPSQSSPSSQPTNGGISSGGGDGSGGVGVGVGVGGRGGTAKPPSSRPSILSMQTVEYKDVGGQMQIEMQRYLDTFPFEFYVVLRDVEALPGVLADTLRQWMARVSQSQE